MSEEKRVLLFKCQECGTDTAIGYHPVLACQSAQVSALRAQVAELTREMEALKDQTFSQQKLINEIEEERHCLVNKADRLRERVARLRKGIRIHTCAGFIDCNICQALAADDQAAEGG